MNWNQVYKEKRYSPKRASSLLERNMHFFNKTKKILDLGCGLGRHLIYLKRLGYDVYGCDISREAVKNSSKIFNKNRIKLADMSKLPYQDNFFDGIISIGVVHHAKLDKIIKTVKEVHRVLKKDGLIFIETISRKDPSFKTGNKLEENTYINVKQIDSNVPHHYFDKKEIGELFKEFELIKIRHIARKSASMPGRTRALWTIVARKK